jgi:hypothetical protein
MLSRVVPFRLNLIYLMGAFEDGDVGCVGDEGEVTIAS